MNALVICHDNINDRTNMYKYSAKIYNFSTVNKYLLIIVPSESRMLIHEFKNHIISYCIFKKCIIRENAHYKISSKVLYKKKMRDAYQV